MVPARGAARQRHRSGLARHRASPTAAARRATMSEAISWYPARPSRAFPRRSSDSVRCSRPDAARRATTSSGALVSPRGGAGQAMARRARRLLPLRAAASRRIRWLADVWLTPRRRGFDRVKPLLEQLEKLALRASAAGGARSSSSSRAGRRIDPSGRLAAERLHSLRRQMLEQDPSHFLAVCDWPGRVRVDDDELGRGVLEMGALVFDDAALPSS